MLLWINRQKEGLKSIGNTTTVRKNPQENKEQLQKFPLNVKFLYATGTWSSSFLLKVAPIGNRAKKSLLMSSARCFVIPPFNVTDTTKE